jgi:hypothetical protein
LNKRNIAELVKDFRKRLRSILDVDYKAVQAIVDAWNKEPEKSVLRQWSYVSNSFSFDPDEYFFFF